MVSAVVPFAVGTLRIPAPGFRCPKCETQIVMADDAQRAIDYAKSAGLHASP